MRLAVSGTYSTGKTITTMALAHYTGITRSAAKTMRELLPISVPGKTLEQCTGSEILMLITRRNTERAVNESHLGDSFISDGSSIHEWIYGTVRVVVGINPTANTTMDNVERTDEIRYFEDVIEKLGVPAKQHAKASYDAFVRLPIEFPMVADGHRPVNERFRQLADEMIQAEVDKANAKYAQVEQVKKFVILDHDLSQETGELTPTLKVKRNIVNDKYAPLFEELYAK